MFAFNDPNADEEDQTHKTDLHDIRKKRDEYTVEIRRQKREELLYKKRNKNLEIDQKIQNGAIPNTHNLAGDDSLRLKIDQWIKQTFDMNQFLDLVDAVNSNDRFRQHYGVIGLRKILSNESGPPIQPVIDANMVPRLIQFMQNDNEPHLQLEAAWALTNVASGTTQQTQSIIDKGGIACFIKLLRNDRLEVAEQAIWAIGNIAGDSANFRDMILKWGGLEPLLHIVNNTDNNAIIKHGTWAVSNLCRGRPLPELKLVEPAIPTLCAVLKREGDVDILIDAAWALSYLSRTEARVQQICESLVIPYLIKHLESPCLALVVPCLRTLGNIVTGTEEQTNAVLQYHEFIQKLFQLIEHKKKAVRREACWALSNITAGTAIQIETVMSSLEYVTILIKVATADIPEVQKEASWILSNATKNSSPQQVARMVEYGVLDCFILLLSSQDPKTVEIVLEGLNNILNWGAIVAGETGSADNLFLIELENRGGVKKIEELQTHPNNEVYVRALRILETHFELENVL